MSRELFKLHGVDYDNGGAYSINGKVFHIRPLYKVDDFPFHGDHSAFTNYAILRMCEEYELADAIRAQNSAAFAQAFNKSLRMPQGSPPPTDV